MLTGVSEHSDEWNEVTLIVLVRGKRETCCGDIVNIVEDLDVLVELIERVICCGRATVEETKETAEKINAEDVEVLLDGEDENDEFLVDDFLKSVELGEEKVCKVRAFLLADLRIIVTHPHTSLVDHMDLFQDCCERHEVAELQIFLSSKLLNQRSPCVIKQGLYCRRLKEGKEEGEEEEEEEEELSLRL